MSSTAYVLPAFKISWLLAYGRLGPTAELPTYNSH